MLKSSYHKIESRKKMSESQKGKKIPEWYREELRQRMKGNTFGFQKGHKKWQGRKHTAESKRKMSETRKGRVPWNKGLTGYNTIPSSEEKKKKISEANKGKKLSKESRERMRKAHLGKKLSEETKEKLRRAHLGRDAYWMKGREVSEEQRENLRIKMTGRKLSEEWRMKIRQSNRRNWDGKRKKTTRTHEHLNRWEYREWRNYVFQRDNYTCQFCGARSVKGFRVSLRAHHIEGWTKYPSKRYDVNNGITLCNECHKYIHSILRNFQEIEQDRL